ncbi:DUF6781 family protein [Ferribacterium limneticum]|uniref:DUF6781 family protein n=1 Tax=Ferribacterium limneticum TaxID=76259 RepID=UPI001CF96F0A|nr:DUF6781 family protein [Ferribacterium limneticum]UCV17733.1 hypothetical protein KI610_12995 [Ferribacterium limneticum]
MQIESGNATGGNIDAAKFEADVRRAVEQGHDVQEMVRGLTIQMISKHTLDMESVGQIASAALRGARDGTEKAFSQSAAQLDATRTRLGQAVAGLDAGLAQVAEASKLALQEAVGRAQSFSNEDLTRARADLESLEAMFVETLQSSAAGAKDAIGKIFADLAEHSRIHGSAVGRQLQETLGDLTQQIGVAGRSQLEASLHLTHATTDLLRQIAAGGLSGLADRVKPHHPQGKEN